MSTSQQASSATSTGALQGPKWEPLALAALLAASVGSGGELRFDARDVGRTGWTIVRAESIDVGSDAAPVATADRVLMIRRWFSLSVAEAARVLGVQRPTIYAWERGDAVAIKNADRLLAVFALATHWRSTSAEPVGPLRKEKIAAGGKSLVELLSERRLRADVVKSTLTRLAGLQQKKQAALPSSGAALAQRFGFRPLTTAAAARNASREARGRAGGRFERP